MAWARGRIDLDCGHAVGLADWDSTFVGDDVRCLACKSTQQVVSMSRIYEARGSRDAKFGEVSNA